MELIMIIGDRSPGLVQRIIIELGRRGIESEKMFMVHEGDKTKIIVEANVGKMNGRLLHALLGLQDVESAEYIHEDYNCFWRCSPNNPSEFFISCGNDDSVKFQNCTEQSVCKDEQCKN